jgi:hypothetical protein
VHARSRVERRYPQRPGKSFVFVQEHETRSTRPRLLLTDPAVVDAASRHGDLRAELEEVSRRAHTERRGDSDRAQYGASQTDRLLLAATMLARVDKIGRH